MTSGGVLLGLLLVEITGEAAFDAIAALSVAVAIVVAGVRILTRSSRVLVDEAPPAPGSTRSARPSPPAASARDRRLPQAPRPRRRHMRRYIDLHLQFRSGDARAAARGRPHRPRGDRGRDPGLEVLIHTEPEESFRPPEVEAKGPYRAG